MIIDCHGHYTTEPKDLHDYRKRQVAGVKDPSQMPARGETFKITDDEIRESLEGAQLKLQRARGTDVTIFSPRASGMGHHIGDEKVSLRWSQLCNDLIHRVCALYPQNFIGVCQLPQSPGAPPKNSELDVPAMIHVSGCCNPAQHTTGSYYLNADTMAFMQLILSDLFKDFPTLKLIIPHGGGAVPFHWGRFRGIALNNKRPELDEIMANNIFFDTCVYHQPGIDLLTKVVPIDNILFASEMVGAVKGADPRSGHDFDDTKRYVDGVASLTAEDKRKIFEGNARKVYSRLKVKAAANV